jgi:hypothetical protein
MFANIIGGGFANKIIDKGWTRNRVDDEVLLAFAGFE